MAKFRHTCTLPLTEANVVELLIADLGVFERPTRSQPFILRKLALGVHAARIRELTEAGHVSPSAQQT